MNVSVRSCFVQCLHTFLLHMEATYTDKTKNIHTYKENSQVVGKDVVAVVAVHYNVD